MRDQPDPKTDYHRTRTTPKVNSPPPEANLRSTGPTDGQLKDIPTCYAPYDCLKELRILNLCWKGCKKSLHLATSDESDLQERWRKFLIEIESLGDKAATWPEFLGLAMHALMNYGFIRIEP